MAVTVADAFLGCLWSQSLNLRKHSFFWGGGAQFLSLCSRIETTAMTFAFVTFALGKTAPLLKADKFQMYFSNLALKVSLLDSQ